MKKIDWNVLLVKITSRKFIAAIIAFVSAICTAFNISALTQEQMIVIITGILSLIGYIFVEGYVDGKNVNKIEDNSVENKEE